ncbi:hypothetical protein [Bacillus massilinigeriensis]|uniref:hypothetical protein n=1 Tax=Bacillus mediterraneensis TaxID=1805474 RepID=UPI0008F8FA05|nr:hypothetical protein [Bacillus mediterraneensis]
MKWLIVSILCCISLLFISKAAELWLMDQSIAEVSFLGMSIGKHVARENFSGYALGFTAAAFIPLMVAANVLFRYRKND